MSAFSNRYEELLVLCRLVFPPRVLEVGTWNGIRATQLCSHGAEYYGFDLFEDATRETDKVEKNVKRHFTVDEVASFIAQHGVTAHLHKGNTRETLPAFVESYDGEPFEFAFIDGGHSVDTIRSDWECVREVMKPGAIVVFDDYYEGFGDTDQYGANKVVEDMHYWLLKSHDPVMGGGFVRLAAVIV